MTDTTSRLLSAEEIAKIFLMYEGNSSYHTETINVLASLLSTHIDQIVREKGWLPPDEAKALQADLDAVWKDVNAGKFRGGK